MKEYRQRERKRAFLCASVRKEGNTLVAQWSKGWLQNERKKKKRKERRRKWKRMEEEEEEEDKKKKRSEEKRKKQ